MVEDPNWDDYLDERVYDRDKPVGTVVDYDRDDGEFSLEPSGEIPKNTWESLGWSEADEYDEDWEDLDYERWQTGEAELTVDYDEWPYALPAERLEDADDGLQLGQR